MSRLTPAELVELRGALDPTKEKSMAPLITKIEKLLAESATGWFIGLVGIIGAIALGVSLVWYLVEVCKSSSVKADLLELLKLLLSWKVLGSGATVWAAQTFKESIKRRLEK